MKFDCKTFETKSETPLLAGRKSSASLNNLDSAILAATRPPLPMTRRSISPCELEVIKMVLLVFLLRYSAKPKGTMAAKDYI